MKRICLIIDNPLRDLDGICLITWHLIQNGAEVFIVPMNFQSFEIPAINPDVILANYVRNNNVNILRSYHNAGARIAIIDTEGIGSWWKDHALNMQKLQFYDFVDEYYCWGKEQADIIKDHTSFQTSRIKVSGSPRYDFISPDLRRTLPVANVSLGYILINTNFPVINPLYEEDTDEELKSWIKNGVSSSRDAKAFAKSSENVFEKLIPTIQELAQRLPNQTFIIRPHPFEAMDPYLQIAGNLSNVQVVKEGTSLQWINHASLLLQMNCLTGLEATMMGVETIGFEWLNETELKTQNGEADAVTRKAASLDEMVELIENLVSGKRLPNVASRGKAMREYIEKNLHSQVGTAAQETAGHLIKLAAEGRVNKAATRVEMRQRAVNLLCALCGARTAYYLKRILTPTNLQKERENKIPSPHAVAAALNRIRDVKHAKFNFKVCKTVSKDYFHPRSGCGLSVNVKIQEP